jgi:hypothetical protein
VRFGCGRPVVSYWIQSQKTTGLQSPASAILIRRGWRPMMVKRAAEIEDRRIVAKRLFDALCAAYSDKYITLIQPREPDAPLPARVTLPPSRGRCL